MTPDESSFPVLSEPGLAAVGAGHLRGLRSPDARPRYPGSRAPRHGAAAAGAVAETAGAGRVRAVRTAPSRPARLACRRTGGNGRGRRASQVEIAETNINMNVFALTNIFRAIECGRMNQHESAATPSTDESHAPSLGMLLSMVRAEIVR